MDEYTWREGDGITHSDDEDKQRKKALLLSLNNSTTFYALCHLGGNVWN